MKRAIMVSSANSNAGKSMEHVREGYRVSKVKSHLTFYRVVNNTVEIIRMLHERMDVEIHPGD